MTLLSRQNFSVQASFYTMALALATLPFTRLLMLPCAVLLFVFLLVEWNWKGNLQMLRNQKLVAAFVSILVVYVATMAGTIYTSNPRAAFADWDCKIWFAVSSICVLPLCGKFTKRQIQQLLLIFCLSVLAVTIANMIWSLVLFFQTGSIDQLFYSHASHFGRPRPTHTSYQSLFCMVAWCISADFLLKKKCSHRHLRILLWLDVLLLPCEIILLESKAGILVMLLTILITAIYVINFRKKRLGMTFGAMALLALLVAAGAWVGSKNISYMGRITNSVKELRSGNVKDPSHSTMQRVVIWRTAGELAVDNLPLGVGTGAANDYLCAAYREKGYTHILQRQLNCHNQFLQTLLSQGVIGILALLVFIGYLTSYAVRRKNYLLGIYTLIIFLNLLVECMLEARAGSNFIPMMAALLILSASENCPSGQSDTPRLQSR